MTAATAVPAGAQEAPAEADAGTELLTAAELQTLVAPVALYPDTLLIQILVGATAPLDVVKASRLLARSEGTDPAALEEQVSAEGFDASVEVLTVAFPEIVTQMAEHIEWTETVGTAMLAQSDDVLDAVQVMRDVAIRTGALVDTEQQVVSRDAATETVIIQPADPEVVYVPQYNPQVVYDTSLSDALVAGAVTFGTIALIGEIFDDDDDWNDYWGCRNCGGWDGGPIIRNPDIDIDVDGNVNLGNEVNIGGGDRLNIDRGDRLNVDRGDIAIDRDRIETDIGWRPDPDRSDEARDRIAARRGEGGATTLPLERPASDADALRDRLSGQTGARDIARDRDQATIREAAAARSPDRPAVNRPSGQAAAQGRERLQERSASPAALTRPAEAKRPNVSRPAAANAGNRSPQIARNSGGQRATAASRRGHQSRNSGRRR
jgi:hypothetical protein